jgi:hypothetical protein
MPALRPPLQRIDGVTDLVHGAHAHRIAVGWLVARQAGINPGPFLSPAGGQLMARWDQARHLPAMLTAYRGEAALLYRIRALCLSLHTHPSAAICGGPEQWWQHILNESILGAVCNRLSPQVLPADAQVPPRTTAASIWWMRRGLNPCNPHSEPATWALVEAVQARVFPSRAETLRPADDLPLPIAALNGQLSLAQRKALLRDLTGSAEGYRPQQSIGISRDWATLLTTWQATAKERPPTKGSKQRPSLVRDASLYEASAVLIHDALFPQWWAEVALIREGLNQIRDEKPSHSAGSGPPEKIQQVEPPGTVHLPTRAARMISAAKKGASQSANPAQSPLTANAPHSSNKAAMRNPKPPTAEAMEAGL